MVDAGDEFENQYREVSGVLLEYGCMVAPYLLGGEWNALRAECARIRASPPSTADERARVERVLDEHLTGSVYHPNYRAFYVHRAITLPHLKEVSHCIERAVLHYFKGDYLSCMLCLLPAVEGALRSYAGWAFGAPDPSFRQLTAALRAGVAESYPERHALYGSALAEFLDRWLYRRTANADLELSFLNRHYALHGLGPESFYRATDCHRLILFFDVFADLLTLEGHGPKHVFLPHGIDEMDRRREHYQRLVTPRAKVAELIAVDEKLMREHSRFVAEARPPRLEQVVGRWAAFMGMGRPPARK